MPCFWAAVGLSHVSAAAPAGLVVFVKGEGVDCLAVGGLGFGAVVEYPDNL